jgi:anthranilate phosphoribosyltransferase
MARNPTNIPLPESSKSTSLFAFLTKLSGRGDLSFDEAKQLFVAFSDESIHVETRVVQIAGILSILQAKGATAAEIAGLAFAMREKAIKIKAHSKNFIDIVGTGSSAVKTFNVSTAAAFVIAGAGLSVAKHGNRSVTSSTGSADVLEKLGVKITSEPETAQACLNGAGICFLFAQKYHSSLGFVGKVRKHLGIRTVFNIIGPLANPANAPKQIVGVSSKSLVVPMAEALSILGIEKAWVVHGLDGLDELTLNGESFVAEVVKDNIKTFNISPEEFGLKRGKIEHLTANSPVESAKIITDILSGKRRDEARNLVVLNAAAALLVGGNAKDPMHAARLAEQSIDSHSASTKLERLITTTNR